MSGPSRWLPWPKRWDIAFLGFAAQLIAYCDRVNLSVAAPMIAKEYSWDPAQIGWILSGFFAGYMVLMIPAGLLVDRFGPKRALATGMTWWSIVTFLTPLCSGVWSMTGARVLVGTGEAATIPSINSMLVRWFPRSEYSRAAGFCWAGGYAGAILAFPLASAILARWGWKAIFSVFAAMGALWLPLWLAGTSDRPPDSGETSPVTRPQPRLSQFLQHSAVWAVFLLHFSSNFFVYVLVSWLPTYLLTNRGFTLSQMAYGSAMPFVAAFLGTNLSGRLIDRFTPGRDRARVRKMFLIPSLLANAVLVMVPFARSPVETVLLLFVAMGLHASSTPVQASNSLDLAPNHTGTLVGFQNTFANIAGVTAPVMAGYMVKFVGWTSVFWLAAAVSCAGIAAFLCFGKAEKLIE